MLRPWLHPGWIHSLTPTGINFKRCLKTLHGFTNKVGNVHLKSITILMFVKGHQRAPNRIQEKEGKWSIDGG
jgi:hypothetical protein